MAKKTTTTQRPFVERLTSNLKTADGRPRNVTLGPKTLIVGPNGSGKSSIQQSLQLALLGSADDLVGRDEVRDNGLLMSMVSAERLAIHAKLSSGEDYTFIAKDSGKPTHDAGIEAKLPLHEIREALAASPATARKAFLGWAAKSVTAADVAEAVPAVYKAKYADISASVGRGKSPVDALLATLEYVGKRQRDAAKEASGAEALLIGMAHDLETAPTQEDLVDAQDAQADAQRRVLAVKGVHAHQSRVLGQIQGIRGQLAKVDPPEAPKVEETDRRFYESMATASGIAVDKGLASCPLCSSAVGHAHLKACATFYETEAKAMKVPDFGPRVNRPFLQSQLELLTNELAGIDADLLALDPAAIEAESRAAQEAYLNLRNTVDRWSNLTKARDTIAEMTMESETYKGMKKELEGVVADLLKRVADGFTAKVQSYLPTGWKFGMLLEDNGKETFRLGLVQGKKLRSALSGAEWATVTCALAMAVSSDVPADRPVLVMPEDRGWDAATLGKVLNSWFGFDGQVVIGTPTKPKKVPAGWTVIDLGQAEGEEPVVEEPAPSIVEAATFKVYVPSAAMSAMLKALGYTDAVIATLNAEKAAHIVANGISMGGAQ
jgi:ABC-type cobalamin/Fe3+-siderophores transport system ATPase subunit